MQGNKTDLVLGDETDCIISDDRDLELADEGDFDLDNKGDLELDDEGNLKLILSHSSKGTVGVKFIMFTLSLWNICGAPIHALILY